MFWNKHANGISYIFLYNMSFVYTVNGVTNVLNICQDLLIKHKVFLLLFSVSDTNELKPSSLDKIGERSIIYKTDELKDSPQATAGLLITELLLN
jgi:hypothetical protein